MPEQERQFQRRQIAYKVNIKDILDSRYIKNEGFTPNYLELNSHEISRINIVGVVIQKSDLNNYKMLVIDDGTGKISARVFENNLVLDKIDASDVVLIIGRPREFFSERYILIETIRKIDPVWARVRKLELENNRIESGNFQTKDNLSEDNVTDLSSTNKILKLVKELDKGDGVSIEELSSKTKDVDKIIEVLLKEGDVFEIKPGKLKVLE